MMKALVASFSMALMASASAESISVANWNDYIDPAILKSFEAESGIKVNYETYDNDDQLKAMLDSGRYDVVVPPVINLGNLIKEKSIQPYDAKALLGYADSQPVLRARLFTKDPSMNYAVPYFWGRIGLVVDRAKVEQALGSPVTASWDMVFEPEKAQKLSQCGISLLDSKDDVYSIYMNYKGKLPAIPTARTIDYASTRLNQLKPFYKKIDSAAYIEDLPAGELCAAMTWEGDGRALAAEHENLEFILPEEGTVIFLDAMAIPTKAKNVSGARKFIDYVTKPQAARINAEFTRYNSPSTTAMNEMVESNAALAYKIDLTEVPIFLPKKLDANMDSALTQVWQEFISKEGAKVAGDAGKANAGI